jgi:hypothetical protein
VSKNNNRILSTSFSTATSFRGRTGLRSRFLPVANLMRTGNLRIGHKAGRRGAELSRLSLRVGAVVRPLSRFGERFPLMDIEVAYADHRSADAKAKDHSVRVLSSA